MNKKSKVIAIFIAAIITQHSLQVQAADMPEPAEQITDDASFQNVCKSYAIMYANDKLSDEVKAALSMRFLILAQNFLKSHVRPEGKIEWNMRPPDGGASGSSPESVKDPEMRKKYKRMLDENMARAEAQTTYDSVISFRLSLLERCVSFINFKPENSKIIADAIARYSKDAEQSREIKRLIGDKAIEQNVGRPEWPEPSSK